MAELLANVAIADTGGLPAPYFIARWRTVGRPLSTWRPLTPTVPIHNDQGGPTKAYHDLFGFVFGISIDPENAILDPATGKPTKQHCDDWAKIP